MLLVTSTELGWDCVMGLYKSEKSLLASDLNEDRTVAATTLAEFEELYPTLIVTDMDAE